MGTRGVIARPDGEGFTGRYHHWDSYPAGLGATLFALRNGHFAVDTEAMLKVLLDDHTGWSTINQKDFALAPGFVELGSEGYPDMRLSGDEFHQAMEVYRALPAQRRPQCYCHGDRSDHARHFSAIHAAKPAGESLRP